MGAQPSVLLKPTMAMVVMVDMVDTAVDTVMAVMVLDTVMVDTVARDLLMLMPNLNHGDMVDTEVMDMAVDTDMVDTEVMDMVDTVESDLLKPNQKPKLKPNHTTDMVDTAVDTEDMVDTDMEVMVSDTDMVVTADMVDTDMVDTDTASKLSFKFLHTIATSLQNYAIITAETSEHILPKKLTKTIIFRQ